MNPVQQNDPTWWRPAMAVLLVGIVQVCYWPTHRAGFVTDYTGLLERLETARFWDFLNSFGFPALHPVSNFFLWNFHHFFGAEGLGWYVAYTALHTLNAWLVYWLARRSFLAFGVERASHLSGAVALLFAVHPYNAEAVVWRVCFNHLFTATLVLLSLRQAVEYLEQGRAGIPWKLYVYFALGLLTFESAVVLPLLVAVLARAWPRRPGSRQWGWLLLPPTFLIMVWLGLNRWLFGSWVGHYGEEVHLRLTPAEMASNLAKYLLKYLTFWRHWPHRYKETLVQQLDSPLAGLLALVAFGALAVFAFWFFGKMKNRLRLAVAYVLVFLVALLPVSNLYVAWILYSENDRYGYLASAFFLMALVAALSNLPRRWLWVSLSALLALGVHWLWQTNQAWCHGSRVVKALLDGFRWYDASEVYVLAYPDNFRGTYMFRDVSGQDAALADALHYLRGRQPAGPLLEVAQFNMGKPNDGVHVSPLDTRRFRVEFTQWGNWWWRRGIGCGPYATEKWKFTPDGNGAIVELLKPAPGAVLIWSKAGQWQSLSLE